MKRLTLTFLQVLEARWDLPAFDADLGPNDWLDITACRIAEDLGLDPKTCPGNPALYPGARLDEHGHLWLRGPDTL